MAAISDNARVWATHGKFTAMEIDGQRHQDTHETLHQLLCDTLQATREQHELDKQNKLLRTPNYKR